MVKCPKFKITDDLTALDRVVICAAEFFGTAILVLLGCFSCVDGVAHQSHLNVSLAFGLSIMIAIQTVGHISGSHINPVLTIAAVVVGDLALIEVPVYFIGQFLGALAGYGALMSVTPYEHRTVYKTVTMLDGSVSTERLSGVCSPVLNPMITPTQGLFVEFLLTLILVLLTCGVWDHRNANKHDSVSIRFGLTVAALAICGGPFTGANMNPARSFAPAVWHRDWHYHWVWWVGPILAGFVGASFYRAVFSKPKPIVRQIDGGETVPLNDRTKP